MFMRPEEVRKIADLGPEGIVSYGCWNETTGEDILADIR